jgi:hypothetical protein
MPMTKLVVLHHLPDNNDRPALERWFRRHHCPEVLAQAPWMTRYVMYRAQPAPPGAEGYGVHNYRVHENWVRASDERRGVKGLLSMTPQPGDMDVVLLNVPAEPTDDFLGAGLRPDERTILRWMVALSWPDGVPADEAEDWYLRVHAPETCARTPRPGSAARLRAPHVLKRISPFDARHRDKRFLAPRAPRLTCAAHGVRQRPWTAHASTTTSAASTPRTPRRSTTTSRPTCACSTAASCSTASRR